MVAGIIAVAACTVALAVVLAAVFYGEAIRAGLVRGGRRLRLLPPEPPRPLGPPIDRLARDLRRLRRASLTHPAGQSHVRRDATLAAYDDALVQACLALGIADSLSDLPPGTERDAERLRVEWLLEGAGLDLG